jgi:DnaJ like chaperone protein
MEFLKSPNAALILAIVYFVFPLDLIPDLFGPFGRLDDVIIFGLAVWRVMKDRKEREKEQARAGAQRTESSPERRATEKKSDPYALFKLSPSATQEEIDGRYKELAKDYHPDRVAHLGEELRKVAHEKMIEIQEAYDTLSHRASGH